MKRCPHGVYWPDGQLIAYGCQMCNPEANEPQIASQDVPKFNRRGSLNLTETGKLPKCPNCQGNAILAMSKGGKCAICKHEFEIGTSRNLRANNRQPGVCPECGSGVHFEVDKKNWKCADCDTIYKAPKRLA